MGLWKTGRLTSNKTVGFDGNNNYYLALNDISVAVLVLYVVLSNLILITPLCGRHCYYPTLQLMNLKLRNIR